MKVSELTAKGQRTLLYVFEHINLKRMIAIDYEQAAIYLGCSEGLLKKAIQELLAKGFIAPTMTDDVYYVKYGWDSLDRIQYLYDNDSYSYNNFTEVERLRR